MDAPLKPLSMPDPPLPAKSGGFPETLWEKISAVRQGGDTASLQSLATAYWRPLYLFLRGSGQSHEDASDHVQGFFLHVLSTEFFAGIEREGGKFRSYLIASLKNWMARGYQHRTALKRGGGVPHLPIEHLEALSTSAEIHETADPDLLYDQRWARELIARAAALVRTEYESRDAAPTFTALAGALPGGGGLPPYPELAATLGGTEAAARKAVFHLRQRFAETVRREIRATVRTASEAVEEFEYLFSVLNRSS
jgi:RNA polymerase sigma-70 factor (ECF subfamily)